MSAHNHVNVRQVVELGRTPFRGHFDALTEHDRRIVEAALERADITDKQHRSWHTLSGGEKQRTQLARALAQEPQEILLDEPTNHLDIRHQLELLDLLTSLDVTCVVALHDLNLAARYCDRTVVLNRGQAVVAGAPEAVLTPDLIRSVYGVNVLVDREHTTHRRPPHHLPGRHSHANDCHKSGCNSMPSRAHLLPATTTSALSSAGTGKSPDAPVVLPACHSSSLCTMNAPARFVS